MRGAVISAGFLENSSKFCRSTAKIAPLWSKNREKRLLFGPLKDADSFFLVG